MTWKLTILFIAVCSLSAARDWNSHPAVVEMDGAHDIFAVGDAHSDAARLKAVLLGAGIIDTAGDWKAGQAVLVTTGDMIDKGPHALDVLWLLRHLRETAPGQGGRVIVLTGNHEAEFMAEPEAPKVKAFADQLRAAGIQPADVAGCRGEWGEFLCSLPFAARVNDVFFSHAGNSGGRTVRQLETDIEKDFDRNGYAAAQLTGDGSLLEARLNGTGPGRDPWINAGLPTRTDRQLLEDYTKVLGVAHIVEGHVPSPVSFAGGVERRRGEMFQRFGLLFLIDTGMSEGVDESMGAALHLSYGKGILAQAVCPDGTTTVLWDSRAPADSAHAPRCGK